MTRHAFLAVVFLTIAITGGRADDPAPPAPRESGLVEEVGRELVQLDVRIDGPPELLATIGPDDLELVIGGRLIERLIVDRTCAGEAAVARAAAGEPAASPSAPAYQTSYLFYFDQHYLRVDGRARAIELARSLVPQVLRDGARVRIVSAGLRVQAFTDWTDDPAVLLGALDQLERDPLHLDTYPAQEDLRVAEVIQTFESYQDLTDGQNQLLVRKARSIGSLAGLLDGLGRSAGPSADAAIARNKRIAHQSALGVARAYQRDERAHAKTALDRFASVLGVFGAVAPPKAVVYFADTVRANPGDHYVELFPGNENPIRQGRLQEFDDVILEAALQGVRLYTVQAAGLTTDDLSTPSMSRRLAPYTSELAASERFDDAKTGLGVLAAETGGRAFLHGAGVETISRRLRDDLGCQFVLSFPPGDLPRDRPLSVLVVARVPHLRVSARPSLIVRGVETRRRERIAQAFLAPDAADPGGPSITVIPTDIRGDRYSALVQIALPPSETRGAWDIGMSLLTDAAVREESSGRVALDRPGVPLVYEVELEFPVGPYELVAVARDEPGERVVSARAAGSWPDRGRIAGFGPLIAIQPAVAAFVRGDAVRHRGWRSLDEREPIDPARPLALVGVACGVGEFAVERRLVGDSSTAFPEIRPAENERCVLFRDLVRAGTLGPGSFVYQTIVGAEDGSPIATAERRLEVLPRSDPAVP
jgi:VWFA-related protein